MATLALHCDVIPSGPTAAVAPRPPTRRQRTRHVASADIARTVKTGPMPMQRVMVMLLLFLIVFLQLKLWGRDGAPKVEGLEQAIAVQQAENTRLKARNAALEAEVLNLKEGREAIEERARAELGLIGPDESFYQVIDGAAVPVQPEPQP